MSSVYTDGIFLSVMPSVYTDGIFPSVYTVGFTDGIYISSGNTQRHGDVRRFYRRKVPRDSNCDSRTVTWRCHRQHCRTLAASRRSSIDFGVFFCFVKESSPSIMVTRKPNWSFRDSKARDWLRKGKVLAPLVRPT